MGHLDNPLGFFIVLFIYGILAVSIVLLPFRMMKRAKQRRLAREDAERKQRELREFRYRPTAFDFDIGEG
jgi:hypothetical protein